MSRTLAIPDRLLVTAGTPPGPDLQAHVTTYGPVSIRPGDRRWCDDLHQAVTASGLFGRGGAGFPSAVKWVACRRGSRRPVVVVNALEGEPASAKDQVLLTHAPHLVVDGAEVVAAALGAAAVRICIPDQQRTVAAAVTEALEQRRRSGIGRIPIAVERVPARYVAGEESALIDRLAGGPGLPTTRVDKSVPLRLTGHPVLVHNPETLAHVALIARRGADWFRQVGTEDAPGSTLVTVTGGLDGPVVFEVELGTPVVDVLRLGGIDSPVSAVLIGGYAGAWCAATELDVPFAPGALASIGATPGVGALVALPATACGITETARIARFMAGESAGQCGPCAFGLPAIAEDLERLSLGQVDPGLLERASRRVATVEGRGACRHPDGVARMVRSAFRVFADDVRAHAAGRPCAGHRAPTVCPVPSGRPGPRSPR